MKLRRYLMVIEKAGRNYSAYCPDLPGCVATGRTPAEVERKMHGAIQMHLAGLREDNLPIPRCRAMAEYIAVQG